MTVKEIAAMNFVNSYTMEYRDNYVTVTMRGANRKATSNMHHFVQNWRSMREVY